MAVDISFHTMANSQPSKMSNNMPVINYKKDDIVIIGENGMKKKRHIFGDAPTKRVFNCGNTQYCDWLYQIDYGIMLEHEGFVLQSNIICRAGPEHETMPM